MKILVDGDACPVKEEIINLAKKYQLPIIIYIDVSHIIEDCYASIIYCDKGKDSVDFELLKDVEKGDIMITQDYGLASLGLSKGSYCFDFFGKEYTKETIDSLLFSRFIAGKARKQKIKMSNPKARKPQDDTNFYLKVDTFLAQQESCHIIKD